MENSQEVLIDCDVEEMQECDKFAIYVANNNPKTYKRFQCIAPIYCQLNELQQIDDFNAYSYRI